MADNKKPTSLVPSLCMFGHDSEALRRFMRSNTFKVPMRYGAERHSA